MAQVKYWIGVTTDTANQAAAPGTPFAKPIIATVDVSSSSGSPEAAPDGTEVVFAIDDPKEHTPLLIDPTSKNPQKSVRAKTVSGLAQVNAVAGTTPGKFAGRVRAWDDAIDFAPFTLRVTDKTPDQSDKVAKLEIVSGDHQAASIDMSKFADGLQVRALDSGNNLVSGANIMFTVASTGAVFVENLLPSLTAPTLATGVTRPLILQPKAPTGEFEVAATCNGQTVKFHLAVLPASGDLSLFLVSGHLQPITIPAGGDGPTDLKVKLVDKSGTAWPYIRIQAQIQTNLPMTFKDGAKDKTIAVGDGPHEAIVPVIVAGKQSSRVENGDLTLQIITPSGLAIRPLTVLLQRTPS